MRKWQVAEINKQLAKELAEECDIDPITALIASARGYTDPAELDEFLSDEPGFSDPKELADIIKAAEIISSEIEKGTLIAVYGDYDCDGISATVLLYSYLLSRGAKCIYYIPDRFNEGYGMNISAVDKLKEKNTGLLITVDNGIACEKEIDYAKKLGMKVVVTDHHLPSGSLPPADAVIDPYRKDCTSSFKTICGAQVAFSLICVLENKEPEELLPYFADLLSVAVVADVMPLTLENRCIVKYGIYKLKTSPMIGLAALMNAAGIDNDTINSGRIAFGISPRINAAGRMGKADMAVELLLSDNMLSALETATQLDKLNTERQQTEKKIFTEAVGIIEENGLYRDRVIVVSGIGWHHGIIGIAASRIAERYGAPCVVIASDGENAVGSGRSIDGFCLYDAISAASEVLTKFGGHSGAAGISLKSSNIDLFRKIIIEYAFAHEYVPPVLMLDCKLNPAALTLDLAESLKQLEPFGAGNQVPVFGVYAVTLQRIMPIGSGKHLRLIFSKEMNSFQALLFGVTPEQFCFKTGDVLDAAVTVDSKIYKDELSLTVQIKALRMNGTDDEKLFYGADNLNRFLSGRSFDKAAILPLREETGAVYKFISESPASEERIKYFFINTIGYSKTVISLLTLSELGLIENNNGVYSAINVKVKTDLKNSPLYKRLLEGSAES